MKRGRRVDSFARALGPLLVRRDNLRQQACQYRLVTMVRQRARMLGPNNSRALASYIHVQFQGENSRSGPANATAHVQLRATRQILPAVGEAAGLRAPQRENTPLCRYREGGQARARTSTGGASSAESRRALSKFCSK